MPQHLRGWDERRQAVAQAADKAGHTRDLLARHGIDCPIVTAAGTGTFEFETVSGVYTELQRGSYIFMDAEYGRNLDRDGARPGPSSRASSSGRRRRSAQPRTVRSSTPASMRSPSMPARRSSATSPPRPTSAPRTSTATSPYRPPPTASPSATRSASSPGHCQSASLTASRCAESVI